MVGSESWCDPTATRLLLTSVFPAPSRNRAFVWHVLGNPRVIVLRDGVWALLGKEDTAAQYQRITAKAEEFGGEAIVMAGGRIADTRAAVIRAESRRARAAE